MPLKLLNGQLLPNHRPPTAPSGASSQRGPSFSASANDSLPDGRKFWATRVPRSEWADLQLGHELLLVRAKHAHVPLPDCIEMATVEGNHAGTQALALAWGWHPDGAADDRPATVLYYRELEAVLRYELRETGCPDVVPTIIPNPN